MESPRITIYGKVIDNINQKIIRDYREWNKDQIWHFGNVNGARGGESEYVLEFDIWNNEPNFNGLIGKEQVSDAENLQVSVWDNDSLTSSSKLNYQGQGFVNVRCTTNDLKSEFKPVFGAKSFNDIYGNVGKEKGILSGQLGGDHAVIQAKIVIPDIIEAAGQPLEEGNVNFVLALTYEYQ